MPLSINIGLYRFNYLCGNSVTSCRTPFRRPFLTNRLEQQMPNQLGITYVSLPTHSTACESTRQHLGFLGQPRRPIETIMLATMAGKR